MKCPVCHSSISSESKECPKCKFDALQQDFLSKADAEYWYHSMVLPHRANWLSTHPDFRISGLRLDKYYGEESALELPFGIIRIGDSAFRFNDTIESVVVPEGVTSIDDCAFQGCESLTNIVLPKSLVEIRWYTFDGCRSLKTLILPENLQMIVSSAFRECISLEEIYIPQSVESIDGDVFKDCTSLKKVHIGISTRVHKDAFNGCSPKLEIIRYQHKENEPSIPLFWQNEDEDPFDKFWEEYTPGYGMIIDKYISTHSEVLDNNSCFIARNNLIRYTGDDVELTIPESVYSIGNCSIMSQETEKIFIPSSVKKIYANAFSGCKKLKNVCLPDGLQEISDGMFCWTKLENIVIPTSVRKIGFESFEKTHIKSLTIPESITEIGEAAFRWCSFLETIHLPDEIKVLRAETFEGCCKLNSVHLPRKLQEIEDGAFWSCQSLKEIYIPETVTSIGDHAFMGCTSLEMVYIPESVEHIGSQAFQGCSNLKRVIVPEHLSYVARVARVRFKDCHEDLTIELY